MGFQPGANLYTQGFGSRPEAVEVPHLDVRDPNANDILFPIGKIWINTVLNTVYTLTSQSSVGGTGTQSNWALQAPTGPLNTLTGDSGGAISPVANNIDLDGTSDQITTVGSAGTITFSIPSTFIAPGSIEATTSIKADTTLTAALGAITATNGNLVLGTAGNKIVSSHVATTTVAGANSFGSVTLVGGTATVDTSSVTASSLIVIWRQSPGATGANPTGNLSVGTIMAATSFDINALDPTDTTSNVASDVSVVGWMIIN